MRSRDKDYTLLLLITKEEKISSIRHFYISHSTLCLPQNCEILHKHCFQFLLGHTVVSREIENNSYPFFLVLFARGEGGNKVYYGRCGEYPAMIELEILVSV